MSSQTNNEEKVFITVPEDSADERLDVFLCDYFEELSRSYIQKLVKEENILLNDAPVKKNGVRIKPEDRINITIPASIQPDIQPENIPLDILFEDDDVLVVNKPKGMVVHPAAGHYSHTLVNAIMYHCGDSLSGINGIMRPGIVHRIDRDTTGSIIICKNDLSHNSIAAQLKEHSVNRIYKAIVIGTTKDSEGIVNKAIGRDKNDRKKMTVAIDGKSAVTHYKTLESYSGYSYMQFKLETGRTHQIRVHMASIGHPLLGDEVYGSKSNKYQTFGQALHAETLGFVHPRTNEYMEFAAPLPEYFEKILMDLRK